MNNSKQRYITENPCLGMFDALKEGRPIMAINSEKWFIECNCCKGSGEHMWSPSGFTVDPDSSEYPCATCFGEGEFRIVTEPSINVQDRYTTKTLKAQ